jgi:hypothetical protein
MSNDLPFPTSLPDFQRLFPDDAACRAYLEKLRWPDGFVCDKCGVVDAPYRFEKEPGKLQCRACRKSTFIMQSTVMERSHTPLSTWFWGAYLVSSLTPGMSAVQFQRQLGLTRYETAFQILHKLRAGMVNAEQTRIGGGKQHVEIDETWIGGQTRGEGRGVHHQVLVAGAIEVRQRKPKEADPTNPHNKAIPRRGGRYAGRLRLAIVPDRSGPSLTGFVRSAVEPGSMVVSDDWTGYKKLTPLGYDHLPVAERGDSKVAEEFLPMIHLIFSNLKSWLQGVHHGRVEPQHLQAYLNEFTFRFNRRFYPFNAFRSLLGIGTENESATYAELYSGDWKHPSCLG